MFYLAVAPRYELVRQTARVSLASAERVAHRRGVLRHPVAAELVSQMGHIMEIELGLNEKRRRDVKLYAHSGVFLKVIGAPGTATGCAGDTRDRNCLCLIEGNSGAADAAFQDRDDAP